MAKLSKLRLFTENPLSLQLDCLIIGLLSCCVRALTIGWHGLNDVEAQTIGIAQIPDWLQMIKVCQLDGNPPVFHFILRIWCALFGWSDVSVKLLSLLISSSFPVLCYLIVAKHLGRPVAWQVSLLTVFCPTLLTCSNLVRPHGLVTILTLLATEQLFNLLARPKLLWPRLKYGLLMAVLMYSHMFAIVIPAGHVFYMSLGLLRNYLNKNQILAWLAASALSLVLFLPWICSIALVVNQSSKLWHEQHNMLSAIICIAYESMNRPTVMQPVSSITFAFSMIAYVLAFSFLS